MSDELIDEWGPGEIGVLRKKLGKARGLLASIAQGDTVSPEEAQKILEETAHPSVNEKRVCMRCIEMHRLAQQNASGMARLIRVRENLTKEVAHAYKYSHIRMAQLQEPISECLKLIQVAGISSPDNWVKLPSGGYESYIVSMTKRLIAEKDRLLAEKDKYKSLYEKSLVAKPLWDRIFNK